MKRQFLLPVLSLLLIALITIPINAQQPTLFGMANSGGANDFGTIFEYDYSTNQFTKIKDLTFADGTYPTGSMMLASNGKMYGLLNGGGNSNGWGVIFEFDPATKVFTKKIELDSVNGRYPWAAFVETSNGKLLSLVNSGGVNDNGVLIEYDPTTNTLTKLQDFDVFANGIYPRRNNLTLAPNGKYYATVQSGGIGSRGTLVEYDYGTNTYTAKVQFYKIGAIIPRASLVLADNGKMYGTLNSGGAYDYGAIFEYDPGSDTAIIKVDLDSINLGSWPTAGLIKASNGKLYGMMNSGGTDDSGVLIEFDPATGTATKKVDFDYTNDGAWGWGELTEVSPGIFYGMLNGGGANDDGTIIKYDLNTNTLSNVMDFDQNTSGSWPSGNLVLYSGPVGENPICIEDLQFSLYPNPTQDQLWIMLEELSSDAVVDLYTIDGKRVLSETFDNNAQLNLTVGHLANGEYIVKVRTGEQEVVRKFTKQ